MNITNFNKLRLNDTENFIDIESFSGHSSNGIIVTAYEFTSDKIEIRRKEKQITMFIYKYDDLEIPEYWKDAEIIYSSI